MAIADLEWCRSQRRRYGGRGRRRYLRAGQAEAPVRLQAVRASLLRSSVRLCHAPPSQCDKSLSLGWCRLTAERKKRTVPKETATEEQIKSLHVTSSHPTHSSSKPGILCLDLHPNQKLVTPWLPSRSSTPRLVFRSTYARELCRWLRVASIATSWSSTARLALLLRLSPDTPSALTASPSTPYSPFSSLRSALLCRDSSRSRLLMRRCVCHTRSVMC